MGIVKRHKKRKYCKGISIPIEVVHTVHVDKDLNWTFDSSVDPRTVFSKLNEIGKGGYGTVYKIVHRPSMKVLAGKLINPELVDANTKEEIEHEIQLMKEVDSIYTVRYYGSVNYKNSLMMLMEYCEKGSLRDLLDKREKVFNEEQISLIISDLLKGLSLIHKDHNIVHRDIKAANLLLTADGRFKIADFGVSRRFDSQEGKTVTIVGTPYWMAPEVINGVSYSFPADIWSVGITAVELAEGAPPYVEYDPTKALVKIATRGFPGYRFPSMHSSEFMDFVSKCVIMDQNKRWSIDKLLEHPFIKRAERLDRKLVSSELLSQLSHEDKACISESTCLSFNDCASMVEREQETINSNIDSNDFNSFEQTPEMANGTFVSDGFNSFAQTPDAANSTFVSDSFNSFAQTPDTANSTFVSDSFNSFAQTPETANSTFVSNGYNSLKIPSDSDYIHFINPYETESKSFRNNLNSDKYNSLCVHQTDSLKFEVSLSENQDESQQPQNTKNEISDKTFSKTAKIISEKIPFTPFNIGANDDASIKTLYTIDKAAAMNIPISRRLPPLFDDDGVISFDTAIHHKKTPIYIASILVLLSFIFFGKECFISLLSIGLFLNLVTTFNEKQPQKKLADKQRIIQSDSQ